MFSTVPPTEVPKIQIVEVVQERREYLAPKWLATRTEAIYYQAEHKGYIMQDFINDGFWVLFSPRIGE